MQMHTFLLIDSSVFRYVYSQSVWVSVGVNYIYIILCYFDNLRSVLAFHVGVYSKVGEIVFMKHSRKQFHQL
jgi:hypothetical protein